MKSCSGWTGRLDMAGKIILVDRTVEIIQTEMQSERERKKNKQKTENKQQQIV